MITTAHREQQCIGTVMQLPTMKEVLFLYLSCVNQGIVLSTTLLIEKTEITCFKPYLARFGIGFTEREFSVIKVESHMGRYSVK